MKKSNLLRLVFSCISMSCTAANAGTITEYWLTAGDQNTVFVIQGNSVINTITTPTREYPIAIGDTVRTYGYSTGSFSGREYLLDGTTTGATYINSGDFVGITDGTTDGTYNYGIKFNTGDVIRYDKNWGNGSLLFDAAPQGSSSFGGITFDSLTNTLWTNSRGGNPEYRNYALDGTLLSSFILTGDSANWGLSYEEATDTLWSLGGSGEILNISKTGVLLEEILIPELVGFNILGGEMRNSTVVPVPAAVWLFGSGLLGLVGVARCKKA